jgi:saccharopine dehydrogenase-like NADP-dependent oxidoreductase
MKQGDKDFTVMRIIMKGLENGKEVSYQYNLLDRFDNNTISMARTTGFTCNAVANLVVNREYGRIGISPPEYLGKHFEFVKNYLEERGVKYKMIKK